MKINAKELKIIRRLASALEQICVSHFGVNMAGARQEARIINKMIAEGLTYKQAERKLFSE